MYKEGHETRARRTFKGRWVSMIAITLIAAAGAAPSTAPEDVILHATDFTVVEGGWSRDGSTSGADGQKLVSQDQGGAATSEPLSHPGDYLEASFNATAGTAYRVWVRIRATGDSKWNDSLWVQFSDSVDGNGAPASRIGSPSGLMFNQEGCYECGVSGWGWSGGSWWSSESQYVQFATSGSKTIRVQAREDGVQIDQVVLSASTYLDARPGDAQNDGTILPRSLGSVDDNAGAAGGVAPDPAPGSGAPSAPDPTPAPAPGPPPAAASGDLRVMTWNIHFGHGDPWGQAGAIAASGADVVLLQEAQTWDEHMPTTYAARLSQLTGQHWYSLWAGGDDCGGGCQGTLILSRLPIVDSSVAVFDGTPVGRAVVDVGGVRVNVFNVHLEYYDTSRRSSQLRQLMDWTRQFGGPRLVGGDFNSWWDEWWIHQMETEYTDTWQDVTGGEDGGFTLNGAVRFDYLFRAHDQSGRLTPVSAEVRSVGLSDHEPLVAQYTVR